MQYRIIFKNKGLDRRSQPSLVGQVVMRFESLSAHHFLFEIKTRLRRRVLCLCRGGESNTRRQPLQGCALPLSYRGKLNSIFQKISTKPHLKIFLSRDRLFSTSTCLIIL